MKTFHATAGFLAVLLACASAATAKSPKATEVKFKCQAGKTMKVVFGSNTATVIYDQKKPIAMPLALAADGFHYASGKYDLRGKGNRVTWSVRGKKPVDCRAR